MTEPESWKITSSEPVADCRVFKVRRDFCQRESDGKSADFFVIENPDWVNVVALDRSGRVILIEQFRQGTAEMNLEIPSGMIDAGEKPDAAARRELQEETGYTSDNWKMIGKSRPNPAIQNNTIFHFLAVDCDKTAETDFDEHESIATRIVSEAELSKLVEDGHVSHALVMTALYYWNQSRKGKSA